VALTHQLNPGASAGLSEVYSSKQLFTCLTGQRKRVKRVGGSVFLKPNESLFEALKSVLGGLDGCCLDNEEEVERVATVLTETILAKATNQTREQSLYHVLDRYFQEKTKKS